MNNLQQVQAYINVYYSQHGLINSPEILAVNTNNGAKIFFIWHDKDEDMYHINDIQNGEIGPMPRESFFDLAEAEAHLASL